MTPSETDKAVRSLYIQCLFFFQAVMPWWPWSLFSEWNTFPEKHSTAGISPCFDEPLQSSGNRDRSRPTRHLHDCYSPVNSLRDAGKVCRHPIWIPHTVKWAGQKMIDILEWDFGSHSHEKRSLGLLNIPFASLRSQTGICFEKIWSHSCRNQYRPQWGKWRMGRFGYSCRDILRLKTHIHFSTRGINRPVHNHGQCNTFYRFGRPHYLMVL